MSSQNAKQLTCNSSSLCLWRFFSHCMSTRENPHFFVALFVHYVLYSTWKTNQCKINLSYLSSCLALLQWCYLPRAATLRSCWTRWWRIILKLWGLWKTRTRLSMLHCRLHSRRSKIWWGHTPLTHIHTYTRIINNYCRPIETVRNPCSSKHFLSYWGQQDQTKHRLQHRSGLLVVDLCTVFAEPFHLQW